MIKARITLCSVLALMLTQDPGWAQPGVAVGIPASSPPVAGTLTEKPALMGAESTYRQGLAMAFKSGVPAKVSKAYFQLGAYYQGQRNFTKARETYNQGIAYARKHLPAAHPMTGLLLCQLSTVSMMNRDFDQALPTLDSGLAILDQNPQLGPTAQKLHLLRELLSHFNLGLKALNRYDYANSESEFQQALALSGGIQEPSVVSLAQSSVGLAQLMQDKYAEAETSLAQALQYARQTHMPEARLMALIGYASLYAKEGQIGTARMYYQEALQQDDAWFNQLRVPKQLFSRELERLDYVQTELDKTTVAAEAPDYFPDALWKGKVFHWNTLNNGTIRVYLVPASRIPGWTPDYVERFKAACKQWQLALGDQVRFQFTEDPKQDADVTVTWSDTYHQLAGVTRCRQYKSQLATADLHFNLKNYDNRLFPPETVYRLSLHEIGHLLGLMGHSRNPRDVMFPSLSMAKGLSSRDTASIRKLYRLNAQISNPDRITLTAFRRTLGFQATQAAADAINSH